MPVITKRTLKSIAADYSRYREFLNGTIGMSAFALGLTAIQFSRPEWAAWASLLFLMLVGHAQRYAYPQAIVRLRRASLSKADAKKLSELEKQYFSLQAAFKNCPVFMAGWIFLGLTGIYGVWKDAGWI